jgi:hypothetical protein
MMAIRGRSSEMPDRLFFPLQQYLDQLLPANIIGFPNVKALHHIWMEPLNITTDPSFSFRTALLIESEIAQGLPGLDAVQLVFAAQTYGLSPLFEKIYPPLLQKHG